MRVKIKEWSYKIIIIILGSIIAAYGITLALYAGFGGATLAVLWQGLSKSFGISIGQASFYVAILMIAFAFFYDRKQIHIGTIIYQISYSLSVDFFSSIHKYSYYIWLNLIIMVIGIVIFAIGTGIYASTNLGRGSYEALTFSIAEKNGFLVKKVRMILDITVVIIGMMLGGKIGICTVVTILISGPIIQFTVKTINKIYENKRN